MQTSCPERQQSFYFLCWKDKNPAMAVLIFIVHIHLIAFLFNILLICFLNEFLFSFCKLSYAFRLTYIRKKKSTGKQMGVCHRKSNFLGNGNGQKELAHLGLESSPVFSIQDFGTACAGLTQQGHSGPNWYLQKELGCLRLDWRCAGEINQNNA